MNYGQYFRTTAKSLLTVVNLAVLAISCAIVSISCIMHSHPISWLLANPYYLSSAVWASTCLAWQSMKTPAPAAGLVPTMHDSRWVEYHVAHLQCIIWGYCYPIAGCQPLSLLYMKTPCNLLPSVRLPEITRENTITIIGKYLAWNTIQMTWVFELTGSECVTAVCLTE